MPDYLVTVHHRDEYWQIVVFVSEPTKRDAQRAAVRQVSGLGAPGPWRATHSERIERKA